MYSTIALGILFGFFQQGLGLKNQNIVIKTEIVRNITVEWNSLSNASTGAVLNNSHQNQFSKEFRASNKTADSTITMSPLYKKPSTNLTNIFSSITDYPIKPSLRFFGKCHKSFKFCQRACRNAYRETCKEFECERRFRNTMKEQCDIACDKQLENAPA